MKLAAAPWLKRIWQTGAWRPSLHNLSVRDIQLSMPTPARAGSIAGVVVAVTAVFWAWQSGAVSSVASSVVSALPSWSSLPSLTGSPSLPEDVRRRLLKLAGARATSDGEIVIEAKRYRSQARNRELARERLAELIRKATEVPKKRRPTRPTLASKRRRLDAKKSRGAVKSLRGKVSPED